MATNTTYEEIVNDRNKFNKKYPNLMWTEYNITSQELESLRKKIKFLINTQNGTDIDDYVMGPQNGFIYRLQNSLKNKKILIVGTGTGREMKYARDMGAIDIQGITMGTRNQKFASEIVGETPFVADMHTTSWKDGSFDIIAAFQVLEHSYSPIIFLLECNRLLSVFGELHIETPPSKLFTMDDWLHHILCPTPRQMIGLLRKSGFKVLKYNEIIIESYEKIENEPWMDQVDQMAYFKAIKEPPDKYPRGDIQRFYNILNNKSF